MRHLKKYERLGPSNKDKAAMALEYMQPIKSRNFVDCQYGDEPFLHFSLYYFKNILDEEFDRVIDFILENNFELVENDVSGAFTEFRLKLTNKQISDLSKKYDIYSNIDKYNL